MKNRTLLVDANYLLKRSMSGAKNVYSNQFGHIGGLYSFMTTLRKLVKQYRINKVILMWDGENGGIYRHRIDRAYKANRTSKSWHNKIILTEAEIKKEKEKLISTLKQRKRVQAYAEELFLRQIEIDEIEADDLIADYCIKYNNIDDIYIYTNDRDYAQLLDLNITIIFDNLKEAITKVNFMFNFEYYYRNALTYKIICGDTSDNIQGIEGLQLAGILKYFPDFCRRYYSVNELVTESKNINQERINNKKKPIKCLEALINGKDRLTTNFKLVNLREPILNDEAREELENLCSPLDIENRGSKNLLVMMNEDGFLSDWNGSFTSYVEPFFTVIMHEKEEYFQVFPEKRK